MEHSYIYKALIYTLLSVLGGRQLQGKGGMIVCILVRRTQAYTELSEIHEASKSITKILIHIFWLQAYCSLDHPNLPPIKEKRWHL